MSRSRHKGAATLVATTIAAVGFGFDAAQAHWEPPQHVPQVPGVGHPKGIAGDGPEIHVDGGRARLNRGNAIHIDLVCSTSTEAGCTGSLRLDDAVGRRVASTRFDLDEHQMESVFVTLPAKAKRLAARRGGWKLEATAIARDSLARSARDTAAVTVRKQSRRR